MRDTMGSFRDFYKDHGWMEGGLTTGYEKTVLDSEMIGMMGALGGRIELDDADEAFWNAVRGNIGKVWDAGYWWRVVNGEIEPVVLAECGDAPLEIILFGIEE